MRFKTLKHKTLPDTFGHFIEVSEEGQKTFSSIHWEISHTSIPVLQPIEATMEMAIEYWSKVTYAKLIPDYLKDYDMVEVEVKIMGEKYYENESYE